MRLRGVPRTIPPNERRHKNGYSTWRKESAFIYVVYCKGYAKIGLTEKIKPRLSVLQCGNPFPIKLLHSVHLPAEMAVAAEKAVFEALNDNHGYGDWFKVSQGHAVAVVDAVIKELEADASHQKNRCGRALCPNGNSGGV